MPWPVYSETFLRTTAQAVQTTYTVPAGRRAVVKSATFANTGMAAGEYMVKIAGIVLLYGQFQAAFASVSLATMAVAYAGQSIQVYAAGPGVHQTVSGFLFREESLIRAAPPQAEEIPVGPAGPLVDVEPRASDGRAA